MCMCEMHTYKRTQVVEQANQSNNTTKTNTFLVNLQAIINQIISRLRPQEAIES